MDPSPTSTALYSFFHDGQEETTRIGPNKKTNNMLITAEEEEVGTVEGKGTITNSICTALDKKNEQHQQNSLQRRKLLLGGVPPMHQMLDKGKLVSKKWVNCKIYTVLHCTVLLSIWLKRIDESSVHPIPNASTVRNVLKKKNILNRKPSFFHH